MIAIEKMDQEYLNKLVKIFNDNRTNGHHLVKDKKDEFIFEIRDNHLVNADIYGHDPYNNEIHIQYDFYDDTLIERIFDEDERLKSEVMETYSGSKVIRLLKKKYLLGELSEVMVEQDGRSISAFGVDGVIDTVEVKHNDKLVEWYRFSKDGKMDIDVKNVIPSDFKPSKVEAVYHDHERYVVYTDNDYLLVLEKYPDGKISSLSLMGSKEIYNKINFGKTGRSRIEFHFDEPVIERALSELKYGKIIEQENNNKNVITIK